MVDSGIDAGHPDLRDRVWRNPAEVLGEPGVDDDANGYVDDAAGWDFTDAPGLPGSGDYLERDPDPADDSAHGTPRGRGVPPPPRATARASPASLPAFG